MSEGGGEDRLEKGSIIEGEDNHYASDTGPEAVGVGEILMREPGHYRHVAWACVGHVLGLGTKVYASNKDEGPEDLGQQLKRSFDFRELFVDAFRFGGVRICVSNERDFGEKCTAEESCPFPTGVVVSYIYKEQKRRDFYPGFAT